VYLRSIILRIIPIQRGWHTLSILLNSIPPKRYTQGRRTCESVRIMVHGSWDHSYGPSVGWSWQLCHGLYCIHRLSFNRPRKLQGQKVKRYILARYADVKQYAHSSVDGKCAQFMVLKTDQNIVVRKRKNRERTGIFQWMWHSYTLHESSFAE
jgi:hypothetical protein